MVAADAMIVRYRRYLSSSVVRLKPEFVFLAWRPSRIVEPIFFFELHICFAESDLKRKASERKKKSYSVCLSPIPISRHSVAYVWQMADEKSAPQFLQHVVPMFKTEVPCPIFDIDYLFPLGPLAPGFLPS